MLSSKDRKQIARERFRSAKRKRDLGLVEDGGRLDEVDVQAVDDVYDEITEDEYAALVEARRQREDFVIDDDGLGYHDDGEERLGDEIGFMERRKKKNTTAALTQSSLMKARRAKAARMATNTPGQEDVDEVVASNRSMWDFVKRGVSNTGSTAKNLQSSSNRTGISAARNVDSILDELDDLTAPSARSRTRRPTSRGRANRRAGRSPAPRGRSSSHLDRRRYDEPEQDDYDNDGAMTFAADTADHDDDDEVAPMEMDEEKDNVPVTKEIETKGNMAPSSPKKEESTTKAEPVTPEHPDSKTDEGAARTSAPVRRLARPKLGQYSAAARKAAEQKKAELAKKVVDDESNPTHAPALDTNSISFKPSMIAAEATSASPQLAAKLEGFLDTNAEEEKYLDMFWMDAYDRNGEIHLYGKVASKTEPGRFVSCCLIVGGNKRCLYALPRRKEDGEPVDMMKVYNEMKDVLQPSIIPRVEGTSWGGKPVKREYAFEDPDIPRGKTEYLKVVYDAKYPVPSPESCEAGGKFIHKILNAGASNIETFILKRKLEGPCWIRIMNPAANAGVALSWCGLEVKVDSPKRIKKRTLVESKYLAPPPIVAVTLKFKTVINPKRQNSEIVSVSAICHKNIQLEGSTDASKQHMTQLSLIRAMEGSFSKEEAAEIKVDIPQLQFMVNERALISRLITQIGNWDPDVIVGHNTWGYDMQVLLSRCLEHRINIWSKIGRRRKMEYPKKSHFTSGKDWAIADALTGRILCDTYLAAKEHLQATTYSLKNLAETQLKTSRVEIDPADVPYYFQSNKNVAALALHTLRDAELVQSLMLKLQILPLSKQLTCIAGNMWSHTIKGNRAERTEYLLLHEFHRRKFLAPEKKKKGSAASGKAKYSGGLVLEPKKGLYDSFILLLDFNSLYPSLIQEYNLCFTTVEWSAFQREQELLSEGDLNDGSQGEALPPLPTVQEKGVLPQVIATLISRRRDVKGLLKKEKPNTDKYQELDIRQKAFKLTANSMYGCLGFSHSRFFAQPIAAMVTSMGRQTLQKAVDIAQSELGLDVIYGDTDSIMINTRISDANSIKSVMELGKQVKVAVNKLYRTLELEIDGVFERMLLLKKKKYAAVTVEQMPSGELKRSKEEKGLDLVRRDWCIQSKDTGRFVLDQILSDNEKDAVVQSILTHLEEVAQKMREGTLPLDKYVITKGISKHPSDYPDSKTLPHVQVAKDMIKNNRHVNVGDHIPYVITQPSTEPAKDGEKKSESKSYAEYARHPDEINRSQGALKPDVEWYLTQQILPPISRLCEPIEGLSMGLLADRLGLDSGRYNNRTTGRGLDDEELVTYTPASHMLDSERFSDVEKLALKCLACDETSEFQGILYDEKQEDGTTVTVGGLKCANPECGCRHWGNGSLYDCMARIGNAAALLVRSKVAEYYRGVTRCDDKLCNMETRQLSVVGGVCLRRGCHGRMNAVYTEQMLHTQLKYLESVFDLDHVCEQFEKRGLGVKKDLIDSVPISERTVYKELHAMAQDPLKWNAFNWVPPTFWKSIFGSTIHHKK